jgi:hypothetical protein
MPILTLLIALGSTSELSLAGKSIPDEATAVIRAVRTAAKTKDYATLRQLMVQDFTWSFGGDGDAHQAIEAWRQDRFALKQLYRVTSLRCVFRGSVNVVQCPPNAGLNYRAGFTKTEEGWRMSYFVAGD